MIKHLAQAKGTLTKPVIQLLIEGEDSVNALHTILHRALNCWADAPKEFFDLADQLLEIHPEAKLLPFNTPASQRLKA